MGRAYRRAAYHECMYDGQRLLLKKVLDSLHAGGDDPSRRSPWVAGGGSKTEATVTIRARRSCVPGGTGDGETADMELRANGVCEATFTGLTSSWGLYADTVALSGDDQVEVVYPNAECSTGTRNLYVDWVEVDSQRVQMEGGSVVFDEDSDTDAFDGLDVEDPDASLTSVRLQVDGALRFVVGENARALCYDQNGNMTWRLREGSALEQQWNADNRLTYVKDWGELAIITFTYDANGVLLAKGTVTDTTVYIGGIYEKELTSGDERLYFFFGGQRIAMEEEGTLHYLVGDNLGTTSVVFSSAGALVAESRHYPYGEERWSSGTLPTDYRFTGQLLEHVLSIYIMGARWYDPYIARWLSADSIVPSPVRPQGLNRYAYVYNCPLNYTDPSGHTVRSALDLIRRYRGDIVSIAEEYGLDPLLLAGVVFAENRNDGNLIKGQDWTSVFTLGLFGGPELRNLFGPLVSDNPSTGITEVSLAVAAMMDDPSLVPDNYGDLSYDEQESLHDQIAASLSAAERQRILGNLSDPSLALRYAAKYLVFLGNYRDYGENYALWLSDYNRGLSSWDTTSEYGRRIDIYARNIRHVLYWQEPDWKTCIGRFGCAAYYDQQLYGTLP